MSTPRIFVAVIVIGAVFGLHSVYVGIRESFQAERTLHAYILTLGVLDNYAQSHAGEWPKNWEDLRDVPKADYPSMYHWPDDIAEIRKRIRIDFSVSGADVAKMRADNFTVVNQTSPNYGNRESRVQQLIDTVSKSQKSIVDNADAP